nr:MAG TPA: bifunctional HTH-domain containing protein/aminotransferase [Caudoviricetes sp.]
MRITNTANRLKEIMDEENLKQVDIIKKASYFSSKYDAKITKTDLSQYVAGKVEPGQAKLFVLASALNVNEAWLMGYDVPKARSSIISSAHINISNDTLCAISILANASGYEFSIFANQFQVIYNDCIIKLSPKEVEDLAKSSIEQIDYVMKSIITNRLKDNKFPIRSDLDLQSGELNAVHYQKNETDERNTNNIVPITVKESSNYEVNAAHARTDIDVPDNIDTSENDIMDDDNF